MSTRCTTHFVYGDRKVAIVYRHSDGYPEGAGKDLAEFLKKCSKLKDPRFGDPSYLAAKYVVFLAEMFAQDFDHNTNKSKKRKNRLDFLSVGVLMEDPGDIEYRYVVDCSKFENDLPVVKCYSVHDGSEAKIPS